MIVTGTFLDADGNPIVGLSVEFALTNYGNDMPRLQGVGIIMPTRISAITDANGKISVTLPGNDTITPVGTYYSLTISGLTEDAIERDYLFSGASADISDLTPENAVPVAAPPIPSVTIDVAPTAQGDFQVAHGLGRTPSGVSLYLTSGILLYFQTPVMWDENFIYLVASNSGSGKAVVW
jgi:hypothetical protein